MRKLFIIGMLLITEIGFPQFGQYLGAGSSITKGLWHLNGNSSDASGNSNTGTDANITYGLANGKLGQGALFNGTSSAATLSTTASLSLTGAQTCAFWIKPNDPTAVLYMTVLSRGGIDAYAQLSYHYGIINRKIYAIFGDGVTNHLAGNIFGTTFIPDATWSHVVVTFNGTSTVKFYLNGKLDRSDTTGNTAGCQDALSISIGKCLAGQGYYMKGSIDELIFENYVWTPVQVQKYYTFSKGRFGNK